MDLKTVGSYIFGPGTDAPSYEALKRKREIADALMKQSMGRTPKDWGEGLGMLGQTLAAKIMDRRLRPQEDAERQKITDALSGLGGGFTGQGMGWHSGNPATMSSGGSYADRIAGIESGGNYGALGPETKSGDRAYGKYQVMGANIPSWSKEALGQALTPEQFLSDPKAQDAIFNHKFGSYVQQYGEPGAASMWFSGDPTPDGDKDSLGTSDTDYVSKFMGAAAGALPGQGGPTAGLDMAAISQIAEIMSNPYATDGHKLVAQALLQRMMPEQMSPYQAGQLGLSLQGQQNQQNQWQQSFDQDQSQFDQQMGLEREKFEASQVPEAPDPYTLAPGAQRYAGDGSLISENPNQSGTSVTTNVINPGDNGLQKELDKAEADVWKGYLETGVVAAQNKADFDVLHELVQQAPQGPIQGRAAEAFPGFSSSGAAFESIVKRVAPTLRAPGSGSTSDIEYDGMLKSLPALRNKPEANALILQMMQRKNEINVARADLVRAFRSGKVDAEQARAEMQALESASIMTPEMQALIQGVAPGGQAPTVIDGYTIEQID